MKRSRISPYGARSKARAAALRACYDEVDFRSQGHCEARVAGVCVGGGVDHHHVGPRSTWPELVCDPRNVLVVCRPCHDWIGGNPADAEKLGLHMRRSVENERRFGL